MSVSSVSERPCVALMAALVPVASFVVLDPGGWYPFGPAKWLAVSLAAAVATAVLLSGRAIRVPLAPAAAWGVLLVWLALAAAVGADPILAWIGTYERHLGWATWLLFACCFVVGSQLRTQRDIHRLVSGIVLASAIVGVYALWELTVGQPVQLSSATARLGGTFGSAAYLGAAASLALPVCAGVAFDERMQRSWRALAGASTSLWLVALLGSGARAAWLGVGVATLLGAAALCVTGVRAGRRRDDHTTGSKAPSAFAARSVVAVVVVAAASVVVVAPRIGEVTERTSPVTSRLDEWRVATRVIANAPVLGVGPEGYRIAFGEHVDARYERAYGRDVTPDRAHSGPLDVAAVGGLPALAAYLALVVMTLVAAWSAVRRGRPVLVGMGLGATAYSVQQLLLFPVAELDVVFWLAAGVLVAASGRRVHTVSAPAALRTGSVLAAGAAAVLLVTGLAGVAADRLARRALDHGPVASGIEYASRAAGLRPDAIRYHLLEAQLADRTGTLAGVGDAISSVEASLRWSPADPVVLRAEASYLLRRAEITGASADTDAALAAWTALNERDPNCWRCRVALGFAAALAGDTDSAEQAWTAAKELSDDPLASALLDELRRTRPVEKS